MTNQELKAYGIDLPNAVGVLDTPEKLAEFHRRLDEGCREAFAEFDRARKAAWAASFTKSFG